MKPEPVAGALVSVSGLKPNPLAAGRGLAAGAKTCVRWLRLNSKIERLQSRWARLESRLAKEHSWFQLTAAEAEALPWAKELRDIDGCLNVLIEQREALLGALPTVGSPSLDSVITKLAVVERLIWPDVHPKAHTLITGSVQDLFVFAQR